MKQTPSNTGQDTVVLGLVLLTNENFVATATEGVEFGPAHGHRVPAVLEATRGGDEEAIARLRTMPGVLHVDVTYAEHLRPDDNSLTEEQPHGS
ncbi:MAG: hypothetical protein R3C68_03665 [Myxococcota bacterium]